MQWLRGWVSVEAVHNEFDQLQQYNLLSNSCLNCQKKSIKCFHLTPTLYDKFKDMTRKRTIKPFVLITLLYILMEFSGMFVMRPYIVQILNVYKVPLDTSLTTVVLGLLGIAANLCLLVSVKFFGKRRIYLWSMVGTFLSCFALSKFVIIVLSKFQCHFIIKKNKIPFFRYLRFRFISRWPNFIWSLFK